MLMPSAGGAMPSMCEHAGPSVTYGGVGTKPVVLTWLSRPGWR